MNSNYFESNEIDNDAIYQMNLNYPRYEEPSTSRDFQSVQHYPQIKEEPPEQQHHHHQQLDTEFTIVKCEPELFDPDDDEEDTEDDDDEEEEEDLLVQFTGNGRAMTASATNGSLDYNMDVTEDIRSDIKVFVQSKFMIETEALQSLKVEKISDLWSYYITDIGEFKAYKCSQTTRTGFRDCPAYRIIFTPTESGPSLVLSNGIHHDHLGCTIKTGKEDTKQSNDWNMRAIHLFGTLDEAIAHLALKPMWKLVYRQNLLTSALDHYQCGYKCKNTGDPCPGKLILNMNTNKTDMKVNRNSSVRIFSNRLHNHVERQFLEDLSRLSEDDSVKMFEDDTLLIAKFSTQDEVDSFLTYDSVWTEVQKSDQYNGVVYKYKCNFENHECLSCRIVYVPAEADRPVLLFSNWQSHNHQSMGWMGMEPFQKTENPITDPNYLRCEFEDVQAAKLYMANKGNWVESGSVTIPPMKITCFNCFYENCPRKLFLITNENPTLPVQIFSNITEHCHQVLKYFSASDFFPIQILREDEHELLLEQSWSQADSAIKDNFILQYYNCSVNAECCCRLLLRYPVNNQKGLKALYANNIEHNHNDPECEEPDEKLSDLCADLDYREEIFHPFIEKCPLSLVRTVDLSAPDKDIKDRSNMGDDRWFECKIFEHPEAAVSFLNSHKMWIPYAPKKYAMIQKFICESHELGCPAAIQVDFSTRTKKSNDVTLFYNRKPHNHKCIREDGISRQATVRSVSMKCFQTIEEVDEFLHKYPIWERKFSSKDGKTVQYLCSFYNCEAGFQLNYSSSTGRKVAFLVVNKKDHNHELRGTDGVTGENFNINDENKPKAPAYKQFVFTDDEVNKFFDKFQIWKYSHANKLAGIVFYICSIRGCPSGLELNKSSKTEPMNKITYNGAQHSHQLLVSDGITYLNVDKDGKIVEEKTIDDSPTANKMDPKKTAEQKMLMRKFESIEELRKFLRTYDKVWVVSSYNGNIHNYKCTTISCQSCFHLEFQTTKLGATKALQYHNRVPHSHDLPIGDGVTCEYNEEYLDNENLQSQMNRKIFKSTKEALQFIKSHTIWKRDYTQASSSKQSYFKYSCSQQPADNQPPPSQPCPASLSLDYSKKNIDLISVLMSQEHNHQLCESDGFTDISVKEEMAEDPLNHEELLQVELHENAAAPPVVAPPVVVAAADTRKRKPNSDDDDDEDDMPLIKHKRRHAFTSYKDAVDFMNKDSIFLESKTTCLADITTSEFCCLQDACPAKYTLTHYTDPDEFTIVSNGSKHNHVEERLIGGDDIRDKRSFKKIVSDIKKELFSSFRISDFEAPKVSQKVEYMMAHFPKPQQDAAQEDSCSGGAADTFYDRVELTRLLKDNHILKSKFNEKDLLHRISEFCACNCMFPGNEDEAFVPDYRVSNGQFKLFITTRRLLRNAVDLSDQIVVDSTYKILWEGHPLYLIGSCDRSKKFFYYGVFMTSSSKEEDFVFLFETIKAIISQASSYSPMYEYYPKFLLTDIFQVARNAFIKVFPESQVIVCWSHIIEDCLKEIRVLKLTKKVKYDLLADLDHLQSVKTKDLLNHGLELFCQKYRDYPDFIHYFKNTWGLCEDVWYEKHKPIATGLNGTGSCRNHLIKFFDLNNVSLEQLLTTDLKKFVRKLSREASVEPIIKLMDLDRRYVQYGFWIQNEENFDMEVEDSGDYTVYKLNPWKWKKLEECIDFNDFVVLLSKNIEVEFPKIGSWKDGDCICRDYNTTYMCKHMLGVAFKTSKIIRSDFEYTLTKHKRGKPLTD